MLITCGSNGSCAEYEGAALFALLLPPLLADADCSGPNESMVIIFDEDIVSATNTWVGRKIRSARHREQQQGTSGGGKHNERPKNFAHRRDVRYMSILL